MQNYIAIDTETALIQPGLLAPPLACLTYSDGKNTGIFHHSEAIDAFLALESEGCTFVGQNIAYDFAVLIAHSRHSQLLTNIIFGLYEDDRVRDTKIKETLWAIKHGLLDRSRLSLDDLSQKYLGQKLLKEGADAWRLRFGELIPFTLDKWPKVAVDYACTDALMTLRVLKAQLAGNDGKDYPDECLQNRAAWSLHLMAVEGMRTDPTSVDALERETKTAMCRDEDELLSVGILKEVKKKGDVSLSKDKKTLERFVTKSYLTKGLEVPRTPPSKKFPAGQVSTSKEVLLESDDALLLRLVDRNTYEKTLGFVQVLKKGRDQPFNPRWNVLVETGRTSCGSSEDTGNLQNQPRKPGVRECFVPPDGQVFVTSDYDTAELRALAQVCYSFFGESKLRDVFLRDGDPHVELAARIDGISAEESYRQMKDPDTKDAFKKKRQFAKIPNFGYPGGLGAESFVSYAKGYGIEVSVARSRELKALWLAQWEEMSAYFSMVAEITSDLGAQAIEQFGSGRIRGGLSFTQAANSFFQGLVADAAKDALWEVTKCCYTETSSRLFGSRPVAFIHDEIMMTSPEYIASEAAEELEKVMVETASKWMPDVPIKASAHIMRRWYKDADTCRDASGKQIPWELVHFGDANDTACGIFRKFEMGQSDDVRKVTCSLCKKEIENYLKTLKKAV